MMNPLITSSRFRKISRKSLSQRIKNIFKRILRTKKDISVSLLRHIYATELLKSEKSIKEEKKIAKSFQHSSVMSQLYRKVI